MLYFAYGSNLQRAGMLARCPAAVPLGPAALPDHRLVFRTWADVEPSPGGAVAGGLWRITPACRAALDLYEDVAGGLYRAILAEVRPTGSPATRPALLYRMAAAAAAPPDPAYLRTIREGCRDFGIDETALLLAARGC